MFKKIGHFIYWLLIAKSSGLSPTPEDKRDFKTGFFRWGSYTPKHKRHVIPTVSVKLQLWNTCQWASTIAQKEVDEKTALSIRLMVCKGKQMGLVSGDGFSNLRSGQKVLQDWGAVDEGVITEYSSSWSAYSSLNPDLYVNRAAKRKIASFWSVSNRDDLLKLLDEGRIATTGIVWYSGFNQGGGFTAPWIISKADGWSVGGHAFIVKGYDLDKKLYICQNSYGENWGDQGDFYITMDYLDKSNYGYFVHLDEVNVELAKFIIEYDGKNVKAKDKPDIFHMQNGEKKPYPNWLSYLAYNGLIRGFNEVEGELLDQVEKGDYMDITKTDYWRFLKDVERDNQMSLLLELLLKNG